MNIVMGYGIYQNQSRSVWWDLCDSCSSAGNCFVKADDVGKTNYQTILSCESRALLCS